MLFNSLRKLGRPAGYVRIRKIFSHFLWDAQSAVAAGRGEHGFLLLPAYTGHIKSFLYPALLALYLHQWALCRAGARES